MLLLHKCSNAQGKKGEGAVGMLGRGGGVWGGGGDLSSRATCRCSLMSDQACKNVGVGRGGGGGWHVIEGYPQIVDPRLLSLTWQTGLQREQYGGREGRMGEGGGGGWFTH